MVGLKISQLRSLFKMQTPYFRVYNLNSKLNSFQNCTFTHVCQRLSDYNGLCFIKKK